MLLRGGLAIAVLTPNLLRATLLPPDAIGVQRLPRRAVPTAVDVRNALPAESAGLALSSPDFAVLGAGRVASRIGPVSGGADSTGRSGRPVSPRRRSAGRGSA